ncbi:unnamed protein product [Caenorhabditis brenneri]
MKEQVENLENILSYDVLDEAMDVSVVQEQDDNNVSRLFLRRNKMKKLLLLEGKLFFSKRLVYPEIDDVADRVQSTVMEKNNMERLTTITFLEFKRLADAAAVCNFYTSTASIQSFTVLVNEKKDVKIIENGLSVLQVLGQEEDDSVDFEKEIFLTKTELEEAEKIYLVVVVKRKIPENKGRSLRIRARAVEETLTEDVKIGGRHILGGVNHLNVDSDKIILVDNKRERYVDAFNTMKSDSTCWMKDVATLESIHRENLNLEDLYLPRLMFCTSKEKKTFTPTRPLIHRTGTPETSPDFFNANPNLGYSTFSEPIPTFVQMFFPSGKNEIYGIFCKYYLSRAGHSRNPFTPEWKSKMMEGFVEKHHELIFNNNFEEIFENQLNCMAFGSQIPWKKEHYSGPWIKLVDLKNEWLKRKEKNGPSKTLRHFMKDMISLSPNQNQKDMPSSSSSKLTMENLKSYVRRTQ